MRHWCVLHARLKIDAEQTVAYTPFLRRTRTDLSYHDRCGVGRRQLDRLVFLLRQAGDAPFSVHFEEMNESLFIHEGVAVDSFVASAWATLLCLAL